MPPACSIDEGITVRNNEIVCEPVDCFSKYGALKPTFDASVS